MQENISKSLFVSTKEETNSISIKELILKIQSANKYLISKWKILLVTGLIGGGIGFICAILKTSVYIASCTFVLEDAKGGAGGQYAGLAALAGINLGGNSNGGIFEGDNIFALYQSRLMIEKALLTDGDFNGKKQRLIDRYIDFSGLSKSSQKNSSLKKITFNGDPDHFDRAQDSVIKNIVAAINKSSLVVTKPDKKLNIIEVDTKFEDELFAMAFNNSLVATVNDFYIKTKTKKTTNNVAVLQKQVDSIRFILNNSIGAVASALDAAPNANPSLVSLRVPSQKKQIDVQANTAIYGEMIKNLELGKISLRQETPLIQVLDKPAFPLDKEYLGKKKAILIGIILGFFLGAFGLLSMKIYRSIMRA